MRSGHRRALVALLAGAAALTGVLALGASPASAIIVRLSNGKYLSYEALGGTGPSKPSHSDSIFSNLDYSGGPVMPSSTNYTIVWTPSNYSGRPFQTVSGQPTVGYVFGVNQYLQDLAHDSHNANPNTNTDSVAKQYNDGTGHTAAYVTAYGGSFSASDQAANGCPQIPTNGLCVTDAQIQAELDKVLTANHLPRDLTHQYYLLTPPDVASCFDAAGKSCSGNAPANGKFCAYHSSSSTPSAFLYANIPDTSGSTTSSLPDGVYGCDPFVTDGSCSQNDPFGSFCDYPNTYADAVLSAVSHEHIESITDPQPNNAWTDYQACPQNAGNTCGGEIGDKCNSDQADDPNSQYPSSSNFGHVLPYNEVVNNRHYWIQMEWSNQLTGPNGSNARCLGSWTPTNPPGSSFIVKQGTSANTVDFNANGSCGNAACSVTDYVWQFNDFIVAHPGDTPQQNTVETTTPTISHTFPQPGTYLVALTTMNADGRSQGSTRQVVSVGAPSAAFSINTPAPTEGAPVAFDGSGSSDSNPSGSISSYSWNFGDGAALGSGAAPTHAFNAGSYTVTLTVTNTFGLMSSVSHTVTVGDESPSAAFNPPSGAVAGSPVTFSGGGSDADGSISSYSWNFGDGSSGAGQNPAHSFPAAGSYNITLTITDSAGHTASVTHGLGVSPPPPPPPPKCRVPSVTGLTQSQASSALSKAHCRTGTVSNSYSSKVKKGHVISQSVHPGTTLAGGSSVKLSVSKGKKPKAKPKHHH